MDVVPLFEPGQPPVTCRTSAAVVGGRVVKVTGPRLDDHTQVGPITGAGQLGYGIAGGDAGIGADVRVYTLTAGGTVPCQVGATAITAGDELGADATGKVAPIGGLGAGARRVGIAAADALANAAEVMVTLGD